jgi:two-component system, LytTR family, response regulator
MKQIRALIVDDESLARARLRQLIASLPEIEIVGEAGDGLEALETIERVRPDVVFLDVEMPELDGLSLAHQLTGSDETLIVFVTAYDRYAVEAFEACAVDYLLKPVSAQRLTATVRRVAERLAKQAPAERNHGIRAALTDMGRPRYLERVAVCDRRNWTFVETREIAWIEAADNYVEIHTAGRTVLVRDSLSNFQDKLDPKMFVRIHRSTIVNKQHIVEVRPADHGEFTVRLRSSECLTVTRTYASGFKKMLENEREGDAHL